MRVTFRVVGELYVLLTYWYTYTPIDNPLYLLHLERTKDFLRHLIVRSGQHFAVLSDI